MYRIVTQISRYVSWLSLSYRDTNIVIHTVALRVVAALMYSVYCHVRTTLFLKWTHLAILGTSDDDRRSEDSTASSTQLLKDVTVKVLEDKHSVIVGVVHILKARVGIQDSRASELGLEETVRI